MSRMGIVILAAALLVPAFAASQQTTVNATAAPAPPAAVCSAEGRDRASGNPDYLWRLRAHEHIDCALAILDDALKTGGAAVTLSREQAMQVRASVWAARDAAARIGR
jgi:hypothetical protein